MGDTLRQGECFIGSKVISSTQRGEALGREGCTFIYKYMGTVSMGSVQSCFEAVKCVEIPIFEDHFQKT